MLDELLAHPGVTETVSLAGPVGLMAIHGGNLEKVTDHIARSVADRSEASLYTVCQPPDLTWHVPSTKFDPAQSPGLRRFIDHVRVVVSIHGYGREGHWTTILLGGRNRRAASVVSECLRANLPEYRVVDDLDEVPKALRGVHPRNPVNLPAEQGVQVELPPRVRGIGPHWEGLDDRTQAPHLTGLIDGLVAAVSSLE